MCNVCVVVAVSLSTCVVDDIQFSCRKQSSATTATTASKNTAETADLFDFGGEAAPPQSKPAGKSRVYYVHVLLLT